MCPNVWDILATIPIRDSVALSVTVKDYSYRSWGVNHSVKDLQKVRKRLRSQMKEQEGENYGAPIFSGAPIFF
ncbi:hypothetical protein Vi05172_g2863 [Venturia inaequalis]|nr:hypothetical protein Vi05172_g2863 [Venturia inaequalis]